MPPRDRKSGRRGWPPHLYVNTVKGRVYYRYRHPVTGKYHQLGTDFAEAAKAARILNSRLVPEKEGLQEVVDRVTMPAPVSDRPQLLTLLESFRDEVLPNRINTKGRKLSPKTLYDYQNRISRFMAEEWASLPADQITRMQLAAYLNPQPPRTRQLNRHLLEQVFAKAVADGYRDDNPVTQTERPVVVVERQRLLRADFDKIRAHEDAPEWFRSAMDLALQTLQRREDLARLRFADEREGLLYVSQQKVEGHGTGHVAIEIGPALREVIERCRDDVASPYMIHCRPARRVKTAWRTHWTQVHPDTLTDQFAELRDKLGLYAHLPPRKRPSFHEIRSLGADLYREAGWSDEEVQALLGHADPKTTRRYLDRDQVRWVRAKAGLKAAG